MTEEELERTGKTGMAGGGWRGAGRRWKDRNGRRGLERNWNALGGPGWLGRSRKALERLQWPEGTGEEPKRAGGPGIRAQ